MFQVPKIPLVPSGSSKVPSGTKGNTGGPTTDEDKILIPKSYLNLIDQLAKKVRAMELNKGVKIDRLDQLSAVGGDLVGTTLVIIDEDTGIVRGVFAANPTPESEGYHLAFFNANKKLQSGIDADDGSFTAAGKNFRIDAESIGLWGQVLAHLEGAVDLQVIGAITALDDDAGTNQRYGFHSFQYYSYTEYIQNGDFETGDLTYYTTTGSPKVIEGGPKGKYCLTVDLNNHVHQTFAAVVGKWYLLKIMSRSDSEAFASVDISGANVTGFDTWAGSAWMQDYCLLQATSTNITITFKSDSIYGDGQWVEFDDISVMRVGGYCLVGTAYPHDNLEVDASGYISFNAPYVRLYSGLTLPEIASPTTPYAGLGIVYFKSDGLPYAKNHAGTEMLLYQTSAPASLIDLEPGDTTITSGSGYLATDELTIPDGNYIAVDDGGVLEIS